ncbi:MAG: RHS repeat protein [Acidobacteria bacterium]|nr:RHS repeat protein [Acidobacteriota bacterium]
MPNAGVVVGRFTGAMVAAPGPDPPEGPQSCNNNPDEPGDEGGDPIELCSGMFQEHNVDMTLPDVAPIQLTRSYRPGDHLSRPFGVGTSHSYEMFLVGTTNGYTWMDLILPSGSKIHFVRTSAGTSWTDAVLEHTSTPSQWYKAKISWRSTGGWDLRTRHGTVYAFPDGAYQTIAAKMALLSIRDRNGNTVTIQRDSSTGRVTRVTSPNGKWIALSYDAANRITQATDNGGRVYQYQYDEGGRPVKVVNPLGGVVEYTYDANNQMLTKKDPNGNIRFSNEYDTQGRVFRQTLANGGVYQIAYTEDQNGNIVQTDVTDPGGYVRRVTYDTSGYFSGGRILTETAAVGQPEQRVTLFERMHRKGRQNCPNNPDEPRDEGGDPIELCSGMFLCPADHGKDDSNSNRGRAFAM